MLPKDKSITVKQGNIRHPSETAITSNKVFQTVSRLNRTQKMGNKGQYLSISCGKTDGTAFVTICFVF